MVIGCSAPTSLASGSAKSSLLAVAELKPTQGNSAFGMAWLKQEDDHVVVTVRVDGLAPNHENGMHIHEKGDCSSPDASSAGEHLNPKSARHGPADKEHHLGDLPSLKSNASGQAQLRFNVPGTLAGSGASDLIGKAIVVHANPDDFTTQPSGGSGARIACGVVLVPANQTYPNAPAVIPSSM
jgi:Cu-Zn family superoxide dismutase